MNKLKYLLPLSIILFSCFNSISQKEIILVRKMNIKVHDPSYSLETCGYGLLVPATQLGRQQVIEYKYSIKPDMVVKNDFNQYYLRWKSVSFSNAKKNDITVIMRIKINQYDLSTAKKNPVVDKNDLDTLTYLKDEENFRASSKIILQASEALQDSSREGIVKHIFNYVIASMEYCIFEEQDRGAKRALKEGKGDCTEYSELMVTLCRAKRIPARIAEGLIPHIDGSVGYHNWAEVFFPKYGWVSFDPTWADHINPKTTFDKMLNSYIKLGNQRYTHHTYCSCSMTQYFFEYRLSDSCTYTSGIDLQAKNMLSAYKQTKSELALLYLDTLLQLEPTSNTYWAIKGMCEARLGKFEVALKSVNSAMENATSQAEKRNTLYAYANYYALIGEKEKAIMYIKEAIENGFKGYNHINNDPDLKSIKEEESFKELMKEFKRKLEKEKK